MRAAVCRLLGLCLLPLLTVSLACSPGHEVAPDDEPGDDGVTYENLGTRWTPPASVVQAGKSQYVAYDSPPAWQGGKNCSGSFRPGAKDLGNYIKTNFAKVTSIGGYNCRQNTANASETSVHGTGRAIDIMISPVNGQANSSAGDVIANWLVTNAEDIGVQYLIWNRTAWNSSQGEAKAYTGPNPHIDHIHAELSEEGAAKLTDWFKTGGQNTGGSAGKGGSSGTSGQSGAAGKGGAGGTSGTAGTSGKAGSGGAAGTSGTAGKGGASGTAGAAGKAGAGGSSGAAGKAGSSGSAGASGGCGAVTNKGQCQGNVLSYCESNKLVTADCSLVGSGQTCGLDTKQNVYDCLGSSSNGACGDITGNGICQGNTLVFCAEGGSLIQMSCTGQGKTCGKSTKGNYYECR